MSKVHIDSDEWYPVYSVEDGDRFGLEVEVTPEQLAEWRRAFDDFEAVQEEMGVLFQAAFEKAERERQRRIGQPSPTPGQHSVRLGP